MTEGATGLSLEELAERLAMHPDFRVLRRLDPAAVGGPPIVQSTVRRAAIVDTETTGMDPRADQVIEIGAVVFEYGAETGQVGPVVASLSQLEDPGRPIPPESTAIHHITDEMVLGKRFDEAVVARLLEGVGLVIAHHAAFDRPFLESRFPPFRKLPWACSIEDVGWKAHGMASSALEFLGYKAGFFYEGHRAEIDCRAVLAVLSGSLGETGAPAFATLLKHAREPTLRVYALQSAIETKDALKARGYRWNPEARVWWGEIAGEEREAELAWLKATVYGGRSAEVEIETVDARVRYSGREGKKERVKV